jgi:glycerol-3-phosphate dehydrogenase
MRRSNAKQTYMSNTENSHLSANKLDVFVVGGGIVGAGLARDAAMRGLRTALVEQGDFASGTSSRSSRLLHGGIRYLAQARIGLVREASKEKTVVHRIAPHLSEPLAFIFPTHRRGGWYRWKLSIGVKLYDLLCGRRNLGRSSSFNKRKTLELLPGLSTHGLTGSVRYYDGLTNDARLVLDTLRSAEANGASVSNYIRFVAATPEEGFWRCELFDERTHKPLEVRARSVVNATGPWSDKIDWSKTSLRLTKGVHLVIDRARLSVPDAVVMAEKDRILFAIPWGERVILGTTDTDYDGPIGSPTCDPEDVRYVLEVVNESFPKANLTESDVMSTWAGLRPLVADKNGDPSDISRRHEIVMGHPGWWDVTGGKLTTYRLMAEETINAVVEHLKISAPDCRTANEPLLANDGTDPVSGIVPPELSLTIVQHYCRSEWARHLEDVMIRRTSWCYYYPEHLEIARQVATWMGETLGWNEAETEAELDRYFQKWIEK